MTLMMLTVDTGELELIGEAPDCPCGGLMVPVNEGESVTGISSIRFRCVGCAGEVVFN